MASFQFQFETLLRLRRRAEETKQQNLAALLRQRRDIERQLTHDQQTIRADKRSMHDALVGSVDVTRIRQHAAHVHQSSVRAQQRAVTLVQLNRQIDQARTELNEAMRQRKAMEALRDKQYRQWKREQDRREAAAVDELAVQTFARREAGGEP